jgi:hypothetical protein
MKMPGKPYPTDILEQSRTILEAWKQINPDLVIGELTQPGLEGALNQAVPIATQITALETQLTDLRNQRDALYTGLWEQLKRVRSGVKAIYGDDSSQYEMVGGTRKSERKSPVKKVKA